MSIDEAKIEPEKEADTNETEQINDEQKKQLNDPSNIPRKGYFFEHDTRQDEENSVNKNKNGKKKFNKKNRDKGDINQKWAHDRFDERQQQPKSRVELVKRYGYDIREEKDVDSIKPVRKNNFESCENEQKEALNENETENKSLPSDSDDDSIGQKLANLRRRKTYPNRKNGKKNFSQRINEKSMPDYKNEDNLENSFQKLNIKGKANTNQNGEFPKRYSSMRNQSNFNPQNNQMVQRDQTYQPAYQNWQPNFHQNYNTQLAPPPGLPLPQTQNNSQFYYIQQSDYVAAQEYAAAMAASLMSNPVFYSNGHNSVPSPSISPLINAQPYQVNRQSKAIPIVNPNKSKQ